MFSIRRAPSISESCANHMDPKEQAKALAKVQEINALRPYVMVDDSDPDEVGQTGSWKVVQTGIRTQDEAVDIACSMNSLIAVMEG